MGVALFGMCDSLTCFSCRTMGATQKADMHPWVREFDMISRPPKLTSLSCWGFDGPIPLPISATLPAKSNTVRATPTPCLFVRATESTSPSATRNHRLAPGWGCSKRNIPSLPSAVRFGASVCSKTALVFCSSRAVDGSSQLMWSRDAGLPSSCWQLADQECGK